MKKVVIIYSLLLFVLGAGVGAFGKEVFSLYYPQQGSMVFVDFRLADAYGDVYEYVPILPEISETLRLSTYRQDIQTGNEYYGDTEQGVYLELQEGNSTPFCVKENIYAKEMTVFSSVPKAKYVTGGGVDRTIIECGEQYFIFTFDSMGPQYFGPFLKKK
jgi:hypothetical protein